MKEIEFESIVIHTINKKEKEGLLKKHNGIFNESLKDTKKLTQGYDLDDERIIYELTGIKIFLFKSQKDLYYFLKRTSEIATQSARIGIE